jgi:predicted transglutaminase-like cysteine proteinase
MYDVENFVNYTLNEIIPSKYVYKSDFADSYNYMYPDANGIKYGDCEDYVISFIEDNLQNQNINPTVIVMWKYRKVNGDYHAWVEIKGELNTYIFDTYYLYSYPKNKAYIEKNYEELKEIYRTTSL